MMAIAPTEFLTHSPEETIAVGRGFVSRLQPPKLVVVTGDLGAGKTTIIKGIAEGFKVESQENVTSPTFTLIHEYAAGSVDLFHFDPYRLAGTGDIADLGFEDYLERGGIIVVEWGERLGELTPAERLDVHIEVGEAETRSITLTPVGARYERLVAELETSAC